MNYYSLQDFLCTLDKSYENISAEDLLHDEFARTLSTAARENCVPANAIVPEQKRRYRLEEWTKAYQLVQRVKY